MKVLVIHDEHGAIRSVAAVPAQSTAPHKALDNIRARPDVPSGMTLLEVDLPDETALQQCVDLQQTHVVDVANCCLVHFEHKAPTK